MKEIFRRTINQKSEGGEERKNERKRADIQPLSPPVALKSVRKDVPCRKSVERVPLATRTWSKLEGLGGPGQSRPKVKPWVCKRSGNPGVPMGKEKEDLHKS